MMRRIYKFPLLVSDTPQPLSMPQGAKVVHVGVQSHVVTLWAIFVESAINQTRWFLVRGTGHEIADETEAYVGTVIDKMPILETSLVWHVFEKKFR